VFPLAWYPESTPQNLEKWKIPSCKPCNDEYGRLEEDFGQILSLCVDPDRLESQGIYKRMRRAFDARYAKNPKDRRIRMARRDKLLKSLIQGDDIPEEGIYPGLGERWNRNREDQVALTIPKRYFDRLGAKVVRGVTYIEDGIFIEDDYEIEPYALPMEGARMFEEAVGRYGQSLSRGPGIVVRRAVTDEDGVSSIYKITIWGEVIIYVSVLPHEAFPNQ
jgi:hypothetical protein